MKKYINRCIITITILSSLFIGSVPITAGAAKANLTGAVKSEKPLTSIQLAVKIPSYCTVTEIFDWGPAVTKIIVNLGKTVIKGSVKTDTFKVHVVRTDPRPGVAIPSDVANGDRIVTKAYVSDKSGNAADSGNYIALEMKVAPDIGLSSPMNYDFNRFKNNSWIKCSYTITQQKDISSDTGKISGLVITSSLGDIKKLVDDFTTGSYTANANVILTYASYAPSKDNGKNPLIIWLDGTGEKGTDPTVAISSNKSCNFASSDIQSYFGGAYVLVPQCPTMWMEGLKEDALMALIKDYVSKNSDIDTNRIYIGGGSNGGYITMLLIRDHPDYFAAAMPTCEALPDKMITNTDIEKIKNIPIWFTAAKTDKTVPPDNYVVPTYKRLIKAGAKDVHFSFFDKVADTTGLYKKADGTPFEYDGHFSFFYVFNNQCTDKINGEKTTIMQWLAAQNKSTPNSSKVEDIIPSSTPQNNSTPNSIKTDYTMPIIALILVLAVTSTTVVFSVFRKKR
jgi:predicted peptidase